MEISFVKYTGALRTEATHLKSGNVVITDAPSDNNGKGESFSPTDLVATSLASCMFTIMGIAADEHGIKLPEMSAKVEKKMASNPRRIEEIGIKISFGKGKLTDRERKILETAALNCPVAKSVHPDIIQRTEFDYATE